MFKTHDKINLENINSIPYICSDMRVKHSEKEYIECENGECIKNANNFGYIQLYTGKTPNIRVKTPLMKCLFGIQKGANNNFNMSLQFTNIKDDENMKYFYEFIENLEFECMRQIGLDESDLDNFISQIKHDKKGKYDPNLSVKLPFHKNSFQTEIVCENSSGFNLFNIQNFTLMQCEIYLDKIWKINDKFYTKWKCSKIYM